MKQSINAYFAASKVSFLYLVRLLVFFVFSFVIVLYLTFSPVINRSFFNNEVLFKPITCLEYSKNRTYRHREEVFFRNKKGQKLYGLYFPVAKPERVILVHHGQYGNLNNHLPFSEYLLQSKNALFIYDYAGFGKSEGSPTIKGMLEDARAAYGFLVNELKVDPKLIVNYGGSLGSGPAAQLAAEEQCAALILISPYTSIKDGARDIFPFLKIYPDFLLTDGDFDTLGNVRQIRVPVLIVHGEKDPCIKITHGDKVFAACHDPKKYMRVADGDHGLICSNEIQKEVLSFVSEINSDQISKSSEFLKRSPGAR